MSRCRYDLSFSVPWRDVLGSLRSYIKLHSMRAEHRIEVVREDIEHLYPDYVDFHMGLALSECEHVFFYVNLYNNLRQFLRYKPYTIEKLGLSSLYEFYVFHSSSEES